MRKLIALFACATLGAGGLWLANLPLVVDAQQEPWESGSPGQSRQLSGRELLQQGELLYQRGRYDEAKQAFVAAAQAGGTLTAAERQRLDMFLNRPQLVGGFDPNSPQPAPQFNSARRNLSNLPPADPTIVRQPVDDLMRQSYLAYQSRNLPEAIRLAQSADQLAAQLQVRYAPGERTPADVLLQLGKLQQRNPGTIQQVSNVRAQNGDVEWAENVSNQPQPAGPRSPKEQAAALVVQARRDLQSGRYEEARGRAMQAQQLPVTYELFEDQPQHILADLDRITGARSFNPQAAQPGPQSQNAEAGQARALVAQARQALKAGRLEEAAAKAQEALKFNVSYDVFEDRPQNILADLQQMNVRQNLAQNPGPQPAPGNGPRSAQAQALLAEARQAMKAGDFATANAKAVQASQLGATYELFDDRPESVLADIQRLGNGPVPAQPGNVAQANPMQEQNTAQARQLLTLARQDIAAGQYAAARQKAQQAQQLRGAYGVFDDRPEVVLADVQRLERTQPAANVAQAQPAGLPSLENRQQALALLREAREALAARQLIVAEQKALQAQQLNAAYDTFDDRPELVLAQISRAVPAPQNVVNASEPGAPARLTPISGSNAQEQARQLLAQARQEMQAGRFDVARAKAEAAAKLNVTYDVFDETPQVVLAEIKQLAGNANPVAAPTELVANLPNQENPFLSGATAPGQEVHNLAEFAPISPNGASARELYQQGLAKLNSGDSQGAYAAFQQAYASGQQLDPYTQQRLQDFLTELHPSRQQLAKAQGTPENPAATVDQQQQILFDKLRTEVLNAVFRAERLRESNSDQALEVLNRAQANVENAQLDAQLKGQLKKQLDRTRQGIEAHIKLHQPNIDLKRRNEEILADIDRQTKKRIQVEQEFAKLVDEFNQLFDERRYAEAEVVAKQAGDLDPENPVAVTMKWKARFAKRVALNDQVKDDKEVAYWQALHEVERDSAAFYGEPIQFPKNWQEITDRRKGKYGPDNRIRTEEEKRIEKSLGNRISLHFDDTPLAEVMRHISVVADVNVVLDDLGMQEVGVTSDQPVSINVDGIQLQSALKLLLEPLGLTYTIQHEVLKITSPLLEQGQLTVVTYPVSDLVVPIPNFVTPNSTGLQNSGMGPGVAVGNGQMSISPYSGLGQSLPGQVQAQVNPMLPNNAMNPALNSNPFAADNGLTAGLTGGSGAAVDYDTLMDLVISTVEPDSWAEVGGEGTIRPYNTTLSLVIRQTQKVHEEIADLLEQLRRLQDLQVTIEVRFVTVTDRFFERIGIDFDFNVQDTVGGPDAGLPPFGSIDPLAINPDDMGMPFDMAPDRFLENRDNYNRPTVVGLNADGTFSDNLDIPFRQGSFDIGVPDFGNFQPGAGLSVGMAILSDIEAFFFIEAAQGDERSNLLFAPKVTLFNGQQATVQSNVQRPFVTSLIPVVGFFSVGFQPQITVVNAGITLQCQAVISADRRFVRLTVIPFFSDITDVFTFSFVSGGQNVGAIGIGQGGNQGAPFGGGGLVGVGGIGGGPNPAFQLIQSPLLQQQGQGQQQQAGGAGVTVTIQQPVVEIVSVTTTVSVPDGGTVLLGGVKRLREGRNMAGVPILNKIPYISRLFKNTGVGRETESLMLMVTPRIIIQEEEEELLGIPVD